MNSTSPLHPGASKDVELEVTLWVMAYATIICIVTRFTPYLDLLHYPFRLGGTALHEACHAFGAIMSRGTNVKITVDPSVKGLTECTFTTGSAGWFYFFSGHMGQALLCAVMLCSSFNAYMSRTFALCIIGIFSILWWYGVGINLRYFLIVFSIATALDNLKALIQCVWDPAAESDMEHFAACTGRLSGSAWAFIWLLISIGLMVAGVYGGYLAFQEGY